MCAMAVSGNGQRA